MTDWEKYNPSHSVASSEKHPSFTESNRFIASMSINLQFAIYQNNLPHTDDLIEIKPRSILISNTDNLVTPLSSSFHRDHYFLSQTE
jgi:hypothetical protein